MCWVDSLLISLHRGPNSCWKIFQFNIKIFSLLVSNDLVPLIACKLHSYKGAKTYLLYWILCTGCAGAQVFKGSKLIYSKPSPSINLSQSLSYEHLVSESGNWIISSSSLSVSSMLTYILSHRSYITIWASILCSLVNEEYAIWKVAKWFE